MGCCCRTLPQPAHATASGNSVQVVYSSSDGTYKLTPQPIKTLQPVDNTGNSTSAVIDIDPAVSFQTIIGIGGSLESSSVYNITHLSTANRDAVMRALFDPVKGNNYDFMRLPIGCPDFCSQPFYTFDDTPSGQKDPNLTNFSIQKDIDQGIISVAHQAMQINPNVQFFASPWSPPAWMKTNGSLINGGSVDPQYYPVLAAYYRKSIQAYEAQGIPIYAFTLQNEPTVVAPYPSASYTWQNERDFLTILANDFRSHSLTTKLWIMDDNPPNLNTFANRILNDTAAGPLVDGVAVHDYAGGI